MDVPDTFRAPYTYDPRRGKNIQLPLSDLLRQSIYERDKRLLDAELLPYESSHTRPSAIALDRYNRGRPHTKRKRSIAAFQNCSPTKHAIPLFSSANRKETMQKS